MTGEYLITALEQNSKFFSPYLQDVFIFICMEMN